MTKLFLLSFIVLAFIFSFTAEIKSQSLVVNGDLEFWTAGVPDGWNTYQNISQENTIIHGGVFSAKHTSDENQTNRKLNQVLTGIQEGQEYTISYWYFDNDPQARARIYSSWLAGSQELEANAAELRPNTYSSNDPNWQQFSVVLIAPPTADGFRFEVRVYKENALWGGSVYYDDFSFSGDIIINPEPTNYPTNFSASVTGLGINLTWTDAVGTQLPDGYIIMAGINPALPVPSDGEPVPDDMDLSDGNGALNVTFGTQQASFGNLEGNTPYYFTIYPYTNNGSNIDYKTNGTAPAANATTSNLSSVIAEDFESGNLGIFTQYSVASNKDWVNAEFSGNKFAKANGFGGDVSSDDWLISPPMELDNYSNEILTFETAKYYEDVIEGLEILISEDYAGTGDPGLASWDVLTATLSAGNYEWTSSGDIDISYYSGNSVYLAFHYNSTGVGPGEAALWEVDNILITGEEGGTIDPEPSNYPTEFSAVAEGTTINITWTDAIGAQLPDKYILYAGINSSLPEPVDGTPVANDPDLSDGSAVLNINYGVQQASFSELVPATTYYFTIYPYTNSGVNINYKTDGTAPSDEATTENIVLVTIETENFDVSWGSWTPISVIGDQVWDRENDYGIGDTPCARMSGYESQPFENEDWLISPALNLNNYINEVITFQNAKNFSGNDLELKVSNDYDGNGDPNSAIWTDLSYTLAPSGFIWTFSGEVDLSGFNGTAVYVAFKFTSTSSASATWEIDDIEIIGEQEATIYPEPSNYPTSFSADASGTSILVTWTDATGTQLPHSYIVFAGTNPSLPVPVDGLPYADDLDLSDGSGAINVEFGAEETAFNALNPGVTYHFVIYPYTNSGNNTDYKTDGTAPVANATTTLTPEPANYPTEFEADATSNSVSLTWTDATGGQLPEMYIIFAGTSASLPVPADGTPVPDDTNLSDGSGALNVAFGIEQVLFSSLTANTTYHFSIYPYTNGGININYKNDGTAPTANVTTGNITIIIINSEDFEDGTLGTWTQYSVASDKDWANAEFSGNKFAKENGFGGNEPSDDWLLSPPIDLDNYNNEILTFETAKNYSDVIEGLEVKISTDYAGGDPYQANWTTLEATLSSGNYEFTPSGDVDISSFNGSAVYIAFHYMSTGTTSGTATTWEVDNIEIKGEEDLSSDNQIDINNLIRIYPNPSNGIIHIEKAGDGFEKVTVLNVTGSLIREYWLGEILTQHDFTDLEKGIYFIRLTDEKSGQTIIKKLILN